ncbi:MAG: dephospho-CoA kinase [Elusimicrobia bacterium]|nr:dephospho-CoA kinase [Elusimicrobiota bacterium]
MKLKKRNKKYRLKIIALTGGIASGKTFVLNEFKKHGIETISCDEIAEEVFYKTDVKKNIKKYFKTLNRKKIAKLIFSDEKKKNQLEHILHPRIIKKLKRKLSTLNHELSTAVIIDIPLLFEADVESVMGGFDKIIVVYCRKKQQLRRLCIRNNISLGEANMMLNSQIPLLKKMKWADYIIDNTGKKQSVKEQVLSVLKKIKRF